MRILCANKQVDCDEGLYWGLRQLGYEVKVCELWWLPREKAAYTWQQAWIEFRPDLVFVSGYWLGRLNPDDLGPPRQWKSVPLVYWAYDDPIFTNLLSLPIIPKAALILTPAEECLRIYKRHGVRAGVLVFGCSPELQRRVRPVERHQFVLVAHNYSTGWTSPFRLRSMKSILLPLVEAGYDLKVWGGWWTDEKALYRLPPQICAGNLAHDRLAEIYAGASIVLGLQFHSLSRTQTSSRVFETLACGAFYLGPDTIGTRTYFQPGKHLALSASPEETLSLARYYLDHPLERDRVAACGQLEVYSKHTYLHRAREFLAEVERL